MDDAEMVVRRFVEEMWGQQRVELADVVVHPRYRADGTEVGRDFVRLNIARMYVAFPDLRLEISHLVAAGNQVAVLLEWEGTQNGPFGGIPPTGRQVRFREACFFRVEAEQVIEGDFVADRLGARIQLGVLPEGFGEDPSTLERWQGLTGDS